jgi:hypothetical protein
MTDRTRSVSLPSRRHLLRAAAGGALAAGLPACAQPQRTPAVPVASTRQATVLGIANERFFPATGTAELEREFEQALTRLAARKGATSSLDLATSQFSPSPAGARTAPSAPAC